MFLSSSLGIPHACGGVSNCTLGASVMDLYSPRVWGCFLGRHDTESFPKVFPTRVGVFLHTIYDLVTKKCIPHACGGVSSVGSVQFYDAVYSPRVWGCFCINPSFASPTDVFPTRVGVFLDHSSQTPLPHRIPHACGGCFRVASKAEDAKGVFPTRVGVFPAIWDEHEPGEGIPHACGGVS